jgi:hypothetical protein
MPISPPDALEKEEHVGWVACGYEARDGELVVVLYVRLRIGNDSLK